MKFDNNNFDLVITDICMPKIDGNGVAMHISISGKQYTPVIGISGTPWLAEPDDFEKAFLDKIPYRFRHEFDYRFHGRASKLSQFQISPWEEHDYLRRITGFGS
ncbi:MAG: hypothetical protein U9N62_03760 [Thermotogota bacterium]|nr:hypothetical protein [Thermotogota bacterium]